MRTDASGKTRISTNKLIGSAICFFLVFVIAVSMVASSGNADPTDVAPGEQSLVTSIVNASVIVFREGLEAVLIFAAITASFLGARQGYRRPVVLGVVSAFVATVLTWFAMTTVISSLPMSEDLLLLLTGGIAVIVLLLVMNWFFHKVYWTDHIKELNSKKRNLVSASETGEQVKFWGFVALGFTAVYREGFEVVLFLQNLNIVAGGSAVFFGVLLGLGGTAIVGLLTFYLHHKLPYKRMLVLTGVLLGLVLVVMIGGTARTLQSLGWIPTTPLPIAFPDWWARWFELVPTYETVAIQLLAGAFVVGSYYAAEWWSKEKRRRAVAAYEPEPVAVSQHVPAFAPAPGAAPAASPAQTPGLPIAAFVPASAALPVRQHMSADRVFAATIALPELAWRSPSLAGSPAAVRGVERAHGTAPQATQTEMSQTLCGHEATTLCGCDASQPVAAAQIAAANSAAAVVRPSTFAPAFTPKPLFADREGSLEASRLGRTTPALGERVRFTTTD